MIFTGFTPETIDFLWGIRMNNNREWFQAHKQQYTDALYTPMKAMGEALFEPFSHNSANILKVSRIYRDARLHHPDPYKESLWTCIRHDVQWWGEHPCLFFEIRPEYVRYGFGLHAPKAAAMEAFRKAIAARPQPFLELMQNTEAATGIPVCAQLYKRPKPSSNPELAPYYGWKGNILCVRQEPVGPEIFGPELLFRVQTLLGQLAPMYEAFNGMFPD